MREYFGDLSGLDEKSLNMLFSALAQNNLPGFDYLEFKAAVHSLQVQMNMDVPTAFQSAFATASTMGLDKEKLLKTARHYLQILDKEKAKLQAAAQKKLKEKVAARKAEEERLQREVAEVESTIRKLEETLVAKKQELANKRETLQTLTNQVDKTSDKIVKAEQNFIQACDVLKQRIAADLKQMEQVL